MIQQDDKVEYIYYKNERGEKEYWGISPVTNIAHKLRPPTKPKRGRKTDEEFKQEIEEYNKQLNHFNRCTEEAINGKVEFITEHLIKQGYCNFERDGDIYHFAKYLDESPYVTMLTKDCVNCGNQVLLNQEIDKCQNCRKHNL